MIDTDHGWRDGVGGIAPEQSGTGVAPRVVVAGFRQRGAQVPHVDTAVQVTGGDDASRPGPIGHGPQGAWELRHIAAPVVDGLGPRAGEVHHQHDGVDPDTRYIDAGTQEREHETGDPVGGRQREPAPQPHTFGGRTVGDPVEGKVGGHTGGGQSLDDVGCQLLDGQDVGILAGGGKQSAGVGAPLVEIGGQYPNTQRRDTANRTAADADSGTAYGAAAAAMSTT